MSTFFVFVVLVPKFLALAVDVAVAVAVAVVGFFSDAPPSFGATAAGERSSSESSTIVASVVGERVVALAFQSRGEGGTTREGRGSVRRGGGGGGGVACREKS